MHELGIVMQVIDQVDNVAAESKIEKVTKIIMEIGEVSSVIPNIFTDAFEWAKKKSNYLKDSELELIILKGITYCRDCKKTYDTVEYAKKCPYCGSMDTYLVTGNEIKIKSIEVV